MAEPLLRPVLGAARVALASLVGDVASHALVSNAEARTDHASVPDAAVRIRRCPTTLSSGAEA